MTHDIYHHPVYPSLEGIYIYEFLVSHLSQSHPNNWEQWYSGYRFYGLSVEPDHHIFKFKGDESLPGFAEEWRYIEVPFSETYKTDPVEACRKIDDDELQSI